jgi:hypothetical protein
MNIWTFTNVISEILFLQPYYNNTTSIKYFQNKLKSIFLNESFFIFHNLDYEILYQIFKKICNIDLSPGNKNLSHILTYSEYQLALKLNGMFKLSHNSLSLESNKKTSKGFKFSLINSDSAFRKELFKAKNHEPNLFIYPSIFKDYLISLEYSKGFIRDSNVKRRIKNDPKYLSKLDKYNLMTHFNIPMYSYFKTSKQIENFKKFKPSYSTLAISNSMTNGYNHKHYRSLITNSTPHITDYNDKSINNNSDNY